MTPSSELKLGDIVLCYFGGKWVKGRLSSIGSLMFYVQPAGMRYDYIFIYDQVIHFKQFSVLSPIERLSLGLPEVFDEDIHSTTPTTTRTDGL
jgi:hypothetical protein